LNRSPERTDALMLSLVAGNSGAVSCGGAMVTF